MIFKLTEVEILRRKVEAIQHYFEYLAIENEQMKYPDLAVITLLKTLNQLTKLER